jgi:hypothetical protein
MDKRARLTNQAPYHHPPDSSAGDRHGTPGGGRDDFADKVCFRGGIDAQNLLVNCLFLNGHVATKPSD